MATKKVKPKALSPRQRKEILAFVNKIRAKMNKKPAVKISRGKMRAPKSCPIARSIGPKLRTRPEVDTDSVFYSPDGAAFIRAWFPAAVRGFIKRFDRGEHPQYVLKSR